MMYLEKLRELREEKAETQANLAFIIKVHEYVYGQYEREYVIMPIKHLNTVCNYFDVSLDYVFEFTNKKNYENIKQEINKKLAGERLKEFRRDNNFTQDNLACILKTERSVISKYERGINIIATPFLYDICKKYHISADYLLGKTDEPKYLK